MFGNRVNVSMEGIFGGSGEKDTSESAERILR